MILDTQSVKDFLQKTGTSEDELITAAARQAEQAAAKWCGREQFESRWYVRTERMGRGRTSIIVPIRPLVAVPAVTFGDEGFAFMASDVTTGTPGEITFTDHGLDTGDGPFRVFGPGVPTPLDTAVDYWIIRVDEDTIRLASSEANADAGTALDITDAPAGQMTRIVGPMIPKNQLAVEAASGIIRYRPPSTMVTWPEWPISIVYRAGVCENGDDAPDDLFNALVEQAAYRFRQAGNNGRLGLVTSAKPAGVVDQYVTTPWAPGVLACLDSYKLINL